MAGPHVRQAAQCIKLLIVRRLGQRFEPIPPIHTSFPLSRIFSSLPTSAQASTSSLPQSSVMQNGDSYDSKMLEDPKFQAGFNMWNHIRELEKKIESLQREMELKVARKQVMIEEVLERSNEEKKAHTRTREEVQSLEKAIAEERKAIEGQKKEIEKVKSQAESWKLKYNGEKDNVASARSEISDLRDKITSKESTIDEMKSAGSQLRERYAASKDKIRDLRAESSNLNRLLTETNARLSELEGFATGFSELDEEHL